MKKRIEMKKERIAIRVTTLPNGYSVDLEKESFMYYWRGCLSMLA